MDGAYFNGKFVKKVKCWRCGSSFYSNRSDAMFCSKSCRLRYYRDTEPKMREIKCEDCDNRSDAGNANSGRISREKRTRETVKCGDWQSKMRIDLRGGR